MLETSQISTNPTISQNTNAVSGSNQDMGKAEFLSLLVAQLQNQDPLSPMENQEFAAQLAQFSSLEQLTDMNASLDTGMEMDMMLTSAVNNTLASNFIGKEVSSYGDTVALVSGQQPALNFLLQDYADEIEVNIYDPAGNLIRTIEAKGLDSGERSLVWDGKNNNGEDLPGGNYSFEVKATDAESESVGAVTISKGLVSSIRYADGQAVLIVNGEEVSLGDVLEIG